MCAYYLPIIVITVYHIQASICSNFISLISYSEYVCYGGRVTILMASQIHGELWKNDLVNTSQVEDIVNHEVSIIMISIKDLTKSLMFCVWPAMYLKFCTQINRSDLSYSSVLLFTLLGNQCISSVSEQYCTFFWDNRDRLRGLVDKSSAYGAGGQGSNLATN